MAELQDATEAKAEGGRPGTNGQSSTNPASATTAPGSDPPKPDRPQRPDDAPLNQRNGADPQNNTRDGDAHQTQGDPIDIATGEMILRQTDVELQSVLPMVLRRMHLSSYRVGRHFGPSWASTLDQRLELGNAGVSFAAEDGKLLLAPTPAVGATVRFGGSRHELTDNRDGGYTLTEHDTGRRLLFAAGENVLPLTAIIDRNGNRVDVERDAAGTPVEVRHSGGYRIRVESDDGLVTALYLREADNGDDVLLRRFVYEDRRLTEVINASGLPMRFTYDRAGRITSWTDRNGTWYRFTYDSRGRVVTGEGSGGFLSGTMEYDSENRITHWTDSLGARTTYHLNEAGQTIREIDPLGGETLSEWNEYDQLLSRTDPLGRTTRYEYDDDGNLTVVTRPDGSQARFEYNILGLPITITMPDGSVFKREYDERGNLTRVTDPLGATTSYAYDERGHLMSSTDALGNGQRVETDAAGLPVAFVDHSNHTTRCVRDRFGRITQATDPLGVTTEFGWTADGRLVWRRSPNGATDRWRYDGEGNLRGFVDAVGQETRIDVTHFDLPTTEIRPDGSRLEFEYNTELRLTSVTNELGSVWRYEYDQSGNLLRETDFNGRTVDYQHDTVGQLVSRTNGMGDTVSFTHDVLGNLIERRSSTMTSRFRYDPQGNMVEASDHRTKVIFRRDPVGRVVAETINGRTVSSLYDAIGRRVRRRTPSGAESTWEYDANSQPIALHTAGRVLHFKYDSAGNELHRWLPGNTILTQEWDTDSQLRSQTISSTGGLQRQRRSYTYRPDGHLIGMDDPLTGRRTFELDHVGRVTTITGTGWTERYVYDPAGKVTHASWPTPPEMTAEEAGDREYSGTLIRRAGTVRYEHDAQGRVVLRQQKHLSRKPDTWRYYWDADDRLVEVLTPDGVRWRYHYDVLGRRVAKQLVSPDGSRVLEQTEFSWDGPVLIEQAHTRAGDPGIRVTVWDYEPNTLRPLAQTERSTLRHAPQQWFDEQFHAIVTDLVGTPTELVSDQGGLVQLHRTTLWGLRVDRSRPTVHTPLQFPGQYTDPESGFHYNFHRHYDPSIGRYTSSDPLGFAGGIDPHGYVPNPHTWIDPLGLKCTRAEMKQMMRSQSIAPDLLQKGVHFNVGRIELRVSPTHSGGLALKPVFSSYTDQAVTQAIRKGEGALEYQEFRDWLVKHAEAGLEMSRHADHRWTGRGRELKALIEALRNHGS
ncbi:RHS repeat-associated core domain-containing protein [Saccharomonospora iraqiensis]|uniref:RHS repeat-associated core domain-containing protein n=1 Tax=Saccharomonospora iraqiensis TaxID=52698 RepID=UPI00040089D7|nr:RHS repeat-associated core domain-containing protein [Saccharomonospora iraqiensis]